MTRFLCQVSSVLKLPNISSDDCFAAFYIRGWKRMSALLRGLTLTINSRTMVLPSDTRPKTCALYQILRHAVKSTERQTGRLARTLALTTSKPTSEISKPYVGNFQNPRGKTSKPTWQNYISYASLLPNSKTSSCESNSLPLRELTFADFADFA